MFTSILLVTSLLIFMSFPLINICFELFCLFVCFLLSDIEIIRIDDYPYVFIETKVTDCPPVSGNAILVNITVVMPFTIVQKFKGILRPSYGE